MCRDSTKVKHFQVATFDGKAANLGGQYDDLAVFRGTRPDGRFATQPAFVIVEILSPDDRYGRLARRLEDYRRWGVPHVWVVDPELKRLFEYSEAGLLQYSALRLPEFDFEISAQELFKDV